MYKILNLLIILIISINIAYANNKKKLPIPRFVSLKVSEANIRTGPGIKFPIKWIFVKKIVWAIIKIRFDKDCGTMAY